MIDLTLTPAALQAELDRILAFIQTQAGESRLVVGLSGGLDSDLTARLSVRALGSARLKGFIILQDDFESRYLRNARQLAADLDIQLVELPLAPFPQQMLAALAQADPAMLFQSSPTALDVGRGKNVLRTFVNALYAEHGFLVMGTTNRTELELGYFLPFGDHIAHICPIMHLYKTQARQLAQWLGARPEVLNQPPAAGLRTGDDDLIGIASWLYHGAPLQAETPLDLQAIEAIRHIHRQISFPALDRALWALQQGLAPAQVAAESQLPPPILERLIVLRREVWRFKRRELGVGLAMEG